MAYGLKYRLLFKDILNNDVRIDFLLKDYSAGLAGYLKGSAGNELILKRNLGSGGEPDYIDSHEFEIEFIPTESINLNTFRSKSNKKWMVKVYVNDEQFYYLWLINTDARQPMNFKRGEPVRLTATDGLGLLKSEKLVYEDVQSVWVNPSNGDYLYIYPYQEDPPSPPSGWVEEQVTLQFPIFGEISYLDALALCLKKVGFDINIAVVCGITTDWIEALSTSTHPLKLIKIYASVFEGKSVYEILQILCKNMNCIISQYDARWFFWRPNELYYTYYGREIFDKDANAIGSESAKPIHEAGSYDNTEKLFYINDNHDTYYFEPYKAITASCEYAKPIQLIDTNYFDGNISKYGTSRIDFDVIKEYSLLGFRLYRESSAVPYSFLSLPTFKIYDGESFDIELYYKSHGSNDNQLCIEIEAIEEGNPHNRIFRFTNYKSIADGDEYSVRREYKWVGQYNFPDFNTYYVSFNGTNTDFFSNKAKYIVESVNTAFEKDNFDYQKITINVPEILIPFGEPAINTGTGFYDILHKLEPTNVTVRIFSMATSTDGNIAVGSSISVGGFDIRKHINRDDKSDNCKIETNEQCDYEPKSIDLNFVDDPLSVNYTHRIGNGSQYWKRTNRSENKALFEILAEDRYNLRTHDVPNIEGDFMYKSVFPIWNRFEFQQGASFVIADGNYYTIKAKVQGKYLEAIGDNSIQQRTYSGNDYQLWKAIAVSGGYKFENKATGQTIKAGSLTDGSHLSLSSGSTEIWTISSDGDSYYRVSASSKTWDIVGYGTSSHLQIYGGTDEGFLDYRLFQFQESSTVSIFANAMFVPWDVQLNFQRRTISGLFVPILDADSSHKATFYTTNQNDKEVVYLRKNITI